MIANYHSHTTRCNHALGTPREYVENPVRRDLNSFGFDGEPYTCTNKSEQQEEVPQDAIDGINNVF